MHPTDTTQTFLFVDIVGYTAITARDGDARAAELAQTLAAVAALTARACGAELVKTIGDAVMLRAADPRQALAAAVKLRRDLACVPGFPQVHSGVHTGSAVQVGADWFGHAVNVASRICGAAAPGEILCTRTTLDSIDDQTAIRAIPAGMRVLRNAGTLGVVRLEPGLTRARLPHPSRVTRRPVTPRRLAPGAAHARPAMVPFAAAPGRSP